MVDLDGYEKARIARRLTESSQAKDAFVVKSDKANGCYVSRQIARKDREIARKVLSDG